MLQAFDTADWTLNHAHEIFALDYKAVGVYLRSDRTPPAEIAGLHSVGMKVFSIWEKGYPTSPGYFSAAQGRMDAQAASDFAELIGQPLLCTGGGEAETQGVVATVNPSSQIFFCVDFDPSLDEINGPIAAYFEAAHSVCRSRGYLASVYGSGLTCSTLVSLGFAHSGFLSMSRGFRGYSDFEAHASILQVTTSEVAGLSVDIDRVVDQSVCW